MMCAVSSRLLLVVVALFARLIVGSHFRLLPEHVFDLDVFLRCQPSDTRLPLNAIVMFWEADTVTRDDFIGKTVVMGGNSFLYTYRHEEIGHISPYMIIYHDCDPQVVFGRCYARTLVTLDEPEELGRTVYLNIDLLRADNETRIICDRGYPFVGQAPALSAADSPIVSPDTRPSLIQDIDFPPPTAANDTNAI